MTRRSLGAVLVSLGLGLAANSLLGPLILGEIRYRFSETLISQGIGLDLTSLVLGAPLAILAAVLTLQRHAAGPALGMAVGAYAAYMAIQYVVGPEYLELPGNNERFFLLHLSLVVLGGTAVVGSWTRADPAALSPGAGGGSEARARLWSLVSIALAALLALRYLPVAVELTAGDPSRPEYRANPTSFLLITVLDLGIFLPALLTAGYGLWRDRRWAGKALHLTVGWLGLVGPAEAAMAGVMWWRGDPGASSSQVLAFGLAAVILAGLEARLVWRLFPGKPRLRCRAREGPTLSGMPLHHDRESP